MIRHLVMYWLKDRMCIKETIDVLLSMRGKIPGLLKIEAEKDIVNSDRSCDICLHTVFESLEMLEAYRSHPLHTPVQRYMHRVMERSASADFEVDEI